MTNTVAMNGVRTLISRQVGQVSVYGIALPIHVPPIPIGEMCLPLPHIVGAANPGEDLDVIDRRADLIHGHLRDQGISHAHLPVLITRENGAVPAVSSRIALQILKQILPGTEITRLRRTMEKANKAESDAGGGALAKFESLTALHECACRPRWQAPGHWLRWRGKTLVALKDGKGVWKTQAGEWMAEHELALDYAHWLFPRYHVWTIRIVMEHPRFSAVFDNLFPVAVREPVPEARPGSHLRLVRDGDADGPGGGSHG